MKKRLARQLLVYSFLLLLVPAFVFLAALDGMAQEGSGTIQGTAKSPWLQRYPALIYVDQVKGTFPPPAKKYHISQKNLVFTPHINPILKGTTVDFSNDDSVVHNVFTPPGSVSRFNLGNYGPGISRSYTFDTLGVSTLLCSLHPDMEAFVIVLQNPYYAFTDHAGNFKIDNVPAGTYQLRFWDEKLEAAPQSVTVAAGKTATVNFSDFKRK
jgi:plastocyanin